jgi:hypothetical protein
MTRRLITALCGATLIAGLTVSSALAGEITGNGKLLHTEDSKWGTGLHARSVCAFSGQEDLQFFTDDEQTERKAEATRGDPGHAQSWGQIPKADRDFLTTVGAHPGMACNPIKGAFEE